MLLPTPSCASGVEPPAVDCAWVRASLASHTSLSARFLSRVPRSAAPARTCARARETCNLCQSHKRVTRVLLGQGVCSHGGVGAVTPGRGELVSSWYSGAQHRRGSHPVRLPARSVCANRIPPPTSRAEASSTHRSAAVATWRTKDCAEDDARSRCTSCRDPLLRNRSARSLRRERLSPPCAMPSSALAC